ncbi:MAG: Na+/H+ antiporter NhaC family protein, partial [Clostridia bacterium]|nr:Na+/H+ antiporter NhaC family protein [Clostridia bacterium]
PITDKHKVSRARLAYNVDCTAAPICIIAPISSWAAAVASYVPPEVEADGYALFLQAIPFNLYALLTLTMLVTLAFLKFDFGPMRGYEYLAEEKGDIYGGTGDMYANISTVSNDDASGKAMDMLLPVIVLIGGCIFGLIYTGGFFSGENVGFIEAFSACDAYMGLPIGGLIALTFTIFYYFLRKIINMEQFVQCIPDGAVAMTPALFILALSWGIEGICRESLGAAVFVKAAFENSTFPMWLLPPVLYLLGTFVSFATGTSWGTFGILIPITFAIFGYQTTDLCMICLSATLAGAVTGDHCSPISETAIMSSTAAQVDFMTHVMTQLPYALFTAGFSLVGFTLMGIFQHWIVTPVMMLALVFILYGMKKFYSGKPVKVKYVSKNAAKFA